MNAMHRWTAAGCALAAFAAAAAHAAETLTRTPVAEPVAAPVQVTTIDAARLRLSSVQAAIETFDSLISMPTPPRLLPAQVAEWKEHGVWLSSLRERYANFLAENGGAFGDSAGLRTAGADLTKQMARMNLQFLQLQEATQAESRKYQTLSNASKARHDIALNAIRNLK